MWHTIKLMKVDVAVIVCSCVLFLLVFISKKPSLNITENIKFKNNSLSLPLNCENGPGDLLSSYTTITVSGHSITMLVDTGFAGPAVVNNRATDGHTLLQSINSSQITVSNIKLVGLSSTQTMQCKSFVLPVDDLGHLKFVSHAVHNKTSILTIGCLKSLLPVAFVWNKQQLRLRSSKISQAVKLTTMVVDELYKVLVNVNGLWLFAVVDTGFAGSVYLSTKAANQLHHCTYSNCVLTTSDINGTEVQTNSVVCDVLCGNTQLQCPVLVGTGPGQKECFIGLKILHMFDLYIDAHNVYVKPNDYLQNVDQNECIEVTGRKSPSCMKDNVLNLPIQQIVPRQTSSQKATPSSFACHRTYNTIVVDCSKIEKGKLTNMTQNIVSSHALIIVLDNMMIPLSADVWEELIELQKQSRVYVSHAAYASDDAALLRSATSRFYSEQKIM